MKIFTIYTLALLFFFNLPAYSLEKVTVLKVVDGDTLRIRYNGKRELIRLIGIDCPESRVNRKSKKLARRSKRDINYFLKRGKRATRFVKTLVKKNMHVYIEFDIQLRDGYKRLLGYVFLKNGLMLNEHILKSGYARLMFFRPNLRYKQKFIQAYKNARKNKRGLWEKTNKK